MCPCLEKVQGLRCEGKRPNLALNFGLMRGKVGFRYHYSSL